MASITTSTTASSTTQTSEHPGMPMHTSSSNYITALQAASNPAPPSFDTEEVKIPDGRRNSQGEILKSPAESWKPDFRRKQSWNQQDLKRELVMSELGKGEKGEGEGEKWANEEGMETGFTEGGREGVDL